jgi:hypothetical protein
MNNKSSAQDRTSPQLREDLASLIEQAIKAPAVIVPPTRDAPYEQRKAAAAPAGLAESRPDRLIEELSAAQEQMRTETPPLTLDILDAVPEPSAAAADASVAPALAAPTEAAKPVSFKPDAFAELDELPAGTVVLAPGAAAMLRNLRSRYLAVLSLAHRHIFDRRIEQLLFFKTPVPHSWLQLDALGETKFRYQGPIPENVLGWALSALPADLKRYAFVDFEAGNGRTLLLAARWNFEHAIGYTGNSEASAMLEMNLAQYSRSYMSCRDVRALRGDRDGIPIPPQPAVLFFPAILSTGQLTTMLSRLAASMRLNPRPVYLVFENSGPESGLEYMTLFRKVPLPFLNRVRAALFSPAKIAVYKSLNCGTASQA